MKQQPLKSRITWWIIVLVVANFGVISIIILSVPWNISNISSHQNPVQNYAEALQRLKDFNAQETEPMNPLCQTQLMTHGQKVERVIILVHGYTSCPALYHELGQNFYNSGFNVLIAPLPYHGLADRMTDAQSLLSAEDLAAYADETVDIAQGLGENVIMMGISAGGVTTAWAAQYRSDIDLAVIISPAFGYKQVPTPLTAAAMNLYSILPDSFEWWDPDLKKDLGPSYAYPRYSKHALMQILRLGFAVKGEAQEFPPAAKKIVVVTNGNDSSVNNELTEQDIEIWQTKGANLNTFEFDPNLGLPHDLIDSTDSNQHIDIVYPRLLALGMQ